MEVFDPLPQRLTSKFGQDVPLHIQQRLHYLWSICHRMAKTALPISHKASRDFVHICNVYGVDLPLHAQHRLCPWCSVVQLPTITCTVSLRKRTRRSQGNLGKEKKMKNEMVYHCTQCDHTSLKEPGSYRSFKRDIENAPTLMTRTDSKGDLKGTDKQSGKNAKFSFLSQLDKLDRRMSAPGRFSEISRTDVSATRKEKRKESEDYIPLTPSGKSPNLLELEASSKKKKKKMLASQKIDSEKNGAPSLGSLQKMFQKR